MAERFYLLPQARSEALRGEKFDLAINQQSFQEMTAEQVRVYCDLIRQTSRFFYSCNLDEHAESVAGTMGIVRKLQTLLDGELPRIHWQTEPSRGLKKLGSRLRGRRRRTGDHKLRRVVYEI